MIGVVITSLFFGFMFGLFFGLIGEDLPITALGRARRARKRELQARMAINLRAGLNPHDAERQAEAELTLEARGIIAELK